MSQPGASAPPERVTPALPDGSQAPPALPEPSALPAPPPLPVAPVDLPPTAWSLITALRRADPTDDFVALGADLEPATLIDAYRIGLFPMPVDEVDELAWWSPVRRGVLHPTDLHICRSLRRALPTFTVTADRAFAQVLAGCAEPSRPGAWITAEVATAYRRLHELGWAHSIEVWAGGRLVGGLYGVAVGGLFAGESMFHTQTDASKAALVGLVDVISATPAPQLIDVQWRTDHLATLGITEVPRPEYLQQLVSLTRSPGADWARWRRHAWTPGSPDQPAH